MIENSKIAERERMEAMYELTEYEEQQIEDDKLFEEMTFLLENIAEQAEMDREYFNSFRNKLELYEEIEYNIFLDLERLKDLVN